MPYIPYIAASLKQVDWPTSLNDVNPFIIVIVGGIIFFGASALWAFYWAAKNGHFENFKKQSEEIFSKDEPIGVPTDEFPTKKKKHLS